MSEDINAQLRAMVSIRGLSEGGNRIPVKKFRGRLLAAVPRQETTNFDNKPATRTVVDLKYDDCTIIEVTPGEAYPYQTVEITIRYSDRKNSGWGVFAGSLAPKIPADKDIWDCVGSEMEMHSVTHQFGYSRDRFIDDPTGAIEESTGQVEKVPMPLMSDCWEVQTISMNGVGSGPSANGASAVEAALRLLEGKTEAEFNGAAFQDPVIKTDPSVSSMILARSFITTQTATGRVTRDDNGVFHVVQQTA